VGSGDRSSGYRVRLWQTELARLAAETGLAVTVCHFPPGTSKLNGIEHRLFSAISVNWRGVRGIRDPGVDASVLTEFR
jgi:Rhodopirellula transposase DDE domain